MFIGKIPLYSVNGDIKVTATRAFLPEVLESDDLSINISNPENARLLHRHALRLTDSSCVIKAIKFRIDRKLNLKLFVTVLIV